MGPFRGAYQSFRRVRYTATSRIDRGQIMRPTVPSQAASPLARASALLAEAARLRERGLFDQAIEPTRQATRLLPNDARVFYNLGLSCLEAGRMGEAGPAFERALTLQPRLAEAAWRLGTLRTAANDMEGALTRFHEAVQLKPSLAEARYDLALLLKQIGRTGEAAAAFRKVRSSAGTTGLGWIAEARALEIEGDDDGVERAARRAATVDPRNAVAQEILGGLHADAGRFAEAEQCFRRALELNPRRIELWYELTRCRRLTPADRPLVDQMLAMARRPGLDAAAAAALLLAIGKATDDLGDPVEAMRAFDAADALRARRLRFDPDAWDRRIDDIIARFAPAVVARAPDIGVADDTPLLIVGMPRSGTTLVEQLISNHPQVVGAGELAFWGQRGPLLEAAGEEGVGAALVAQPANDYLSVLRRLGPESTRVCDKSPYNYLWAGWIHLAFPSATIIHCRRRAVDVALSIHQTWFAEAIGLPTGGDALVRYYRAYERLAAHWRRVLPADRFVEVDYETLVETPEPEVRRLVAAAGLAWHDACLHPDRNDRRVKTASKWQARQPIHRGSVDRWRRYEACLGPLAALLEDGPDKPRA
jgi:tetratricopeptide (TPR) repeat protein